MESEAQRQRRLSAVSDVMRHRRHHTLRGENAEESTIRRFKEAVKDIKIESCQNCHRKGFNLNPTVASSSRRATQSSCRYCRNNSKFTAENGVLPDLIVPEELKKLTLLEEMLIARVLPEMMVVRLKGGQFGYSAHCISFPQETVAIATCLPKNIADLDVVIIKKIGLHNNHKDFLVNRSRVLAALRCLQRINPYYTNIEIEEENDLPENSVPSNFKAVFLDNNRTADVDVDEDDDSHQIEHTVVLGENKEEKTEIQKIRDIVNWPKPGEVPVSEFQEEGLFTKCFPTLFPTGSGDPTSLDYGILQEVKKAEEYKYLLHFEDGRFAQHPRFRYFIFSMIQRHRALTASRIFVKHTHDNLTIAELQELASHDANVLFSKLELYTLSLNGSSAWKRERKQDLLQMIKYKGLPHFFVTISAADLQWHQLQLILTKFYNPDAVDVDDSGRSSRVISNPGVCDEYFDLIIKYLIKIVFKEYFKTSDHWFIYEWQHRGSIHTHGLLWLESPPVSDFELAARENNKEFLDFLGTFVSAWNPLGPTVEDIESGVSPALPQNFYCIENMKHPSSLKISDTVCTDDLSQVINFVNRHTKCSTTTCLRSIKGKQECKTKFPKQLKPISQCVVDGNNVTFEPARNDHFLNQFNPLLSVIVRSNIDIKPVVSIHALIQYLTKYMTKREPHSTPASEILQQLSVVNTTSEQPAQKLYSRFLMRLIANRDFSSQEVMHYLLQLPGFHCSRTFISGNVENNYMLDPSNLQDDSGMMQTPRPLYQRYKQRTGLEDFSFFEYLERINPYTERPRINWTIPRIKPHVVLPDPNCPSEYFCKIRLLSFFTPK